MASRFPRYPAAAAQGHAGRSRRCLCPLRCWGKDGATSLRCHLAVPGPAHGVAWSSAPLRAEGLTRLCPGLPAPRRARGVLQAGVGAGVRAWVQGGAWAQGWLQGCAGVRGWVQSAQLQLAGSCSSFQLPSKAEAQQWPHGVLLSLAGDAAQPPAGTGRADGVCRDVWVLWGCVGPAEPRSRQPGWCRDRTDTVLAGGMCSAVQGLHCCSRWLSARLLTPALGLTTVPWPRSSSGGWQWGRGQAIAQHCIAVYEPSRGFACL